MKFNAFLAAAPQAPKPADGRSSEFHQTGSIASKIGRMQQNRDWLSFPPTPRQTDIWLETGGKYCLSLVLRGPAGRIQNCTRPKPRDPSASRAPIATDSNG
jgi:hypothetical protein